MIGTAIDSKHRLEVLLLKALRCI